MLSHSHISLLSHCGLILAKKVESHCGLILAKKVELVFTPKHTYTLDPVKLDWADCAVQA